MSSRTFLLVEYRAADGTPLITEAVSGTPIAEIIAQAAMSGYDIMSVHRLTIRSNGTVTEDISAEVCRAVTERYQDDEDGIPDDWSELFKRVGKSVVDANTDAEIARADASQEWQRYMHEMGADYRAAVR